MVILSQSQKNTILASRGVKKFKFDQIYTKRYQIITLIIEYIFIVNLLEDINIDIIFYKFRQTEESLSCLKRRILF
jgi:hypothetical protein